MTAPDPATTAANAEDDCAHVYVSEHKPGHRIYWLRYCMLCGKPDWDEIDRQVDEVVAEATARERQRIRQLATEVNARYVVAEWPPYTTTQRRLEHRPFADLLDGAS